VSKSGQGNEKLRYSNGDEFEGPMQYLHTLFNPVGQGKYRVAATGALYSGELHSSCCLRSNVCQLMRAGGAQAIFAMGSWKGTGVSPCQMETKPSVQFAHAPLAVCGCSSC
jgi:hypothetical protein